jgi:hypothetical protein
MPEVSIEELRDRFLELESEIHLLDRLYKLREQGDLSQIKQHTVLAFMEDDTVEIYGYTKPDRAVKKEKELLSNPECSNVVYVRASTPGAIRSSYRNYLTNPADFVELINDAIYSAEMDFPE